MGQEIKRERHYTSAHGAPSSADLPVPGARASEANSRPNQALGRPLGSFHFVPCTATVTVGQGFGVREAYTCALAGGRGMRYLRLPLSCVQTLCAAI